MRCFLLLLTLGLFNGCHLPDNRVNPPLLKISSNGHFFTDGRGNPFFRLGDTGWLMFGKLTREEAVTYPDDRKEKGFNVFQVMVLHSLKYCNVYGDSALIKQDPSKPLVTRGNDFNQPEEYDFWDHVDYIAGQAEERGIFLAMVPVWDSHVKSGKVSREQAAAFACTTGKKSILQWTDWKENR